jgi:hypothetical protein
MFRSQLLPRMTASIFLLFFCLASTLTHARIVPGQLFTAHDTSAKPPTIVIGFLGGFVAHDNPVHSEVQLAARLRKEYASSVDVETFENYRSARAYDKILSLLDPNHRGTLTSDEKGKARIIIYGHSWGGAATIALARALAKDGIPVALTIQVDSVSKNGIDDTTIPTNVARAANFYQPHGIIHGAQEIRAADAAQTRIIGNFRFDYAKSSLNCLKYPWYDRIFMRSHIQIECDPRVWDQVESLIRADLPPVPTNTPPQ